MASRRVIKLEFHEHRLACPCCRTNLEFHTPTTPTLSGERACPKCPAARSRLPNQSLWPGAFV